jgi:hypothetical protein
MYAYYSTKKSETFHFFAQIGMGRRSFGVDADLQTRLGQNWEPKLESCSGDTRKRGLVTKERQQSC